jgi:hypothetical protein
MAAAQELADRLAGHLPENVPARHIQRRLDVRVAAHRLVHAPVDKAQRRRIETDQGGSQLGDAGARAFGIGRQVGGTQGADLAVAGEPLVGLRGDHGAVEGADTVLVRPVVSALDQRQVDLVDPDAGDAHGGRGSWPFAANDPLIQFAPQGNHRSAANTCGRVATST